MLNNTISCVIFSMDRPMQLHLLLRSIFEQIDMPIFIFVIYKASNIRYYEAYKWLIKRYGTCVTFIKQEENNFKELLIQSLSFIMTDKMIFLVDDNVIINPIIISCVLEHDASQYVLSLRLGKCLNKCYTMQKPQSVPSLIKYNNDLFLWHWNIGEHDWRYPLSVDGHIFNTQEIKDIIKSIEFKAPNSLEGAMQIYNKQFLNRNGLCFEFPKLVNIPINKVQTENNNICGSVHQDYLLDKWEQSYEIDTTNIYGMRPESAHQEINIEFVERIWKK